jgi:hypothetical protein
MSKEVPMFLDEIRKKAVRISPDRGTLVLTPLNPLLMKSEVAR